MSDSSLHDYQAFVGPPERYDLMGATQVALLYALGLRSSHRVLDIGCGSLRAGRLLIPYLNAGGYTGLEPNDWLVQEAIDKEIGRDILTIKSPRFANNESFDVSGLGSFDYVLAQSIASHTGPAMTRALLSAISQSLAPSGIAAITFVHATNKDSTQEGWNYPDWRTYRRKTVNRWLKEGNLHGRPIPWFHPGKQTWWVAVLEDAHLPPISFTSQLRGVTSAYADSWRPASQIRKRVREIRRSVSPATSMGPP